MDVSESPCPGGEMHEVYHSETISGFVWIDDDWYPIGGTTGGGGGGGGGGGVNPGLGENPLPTEPDPGTDPTQLTYQLTPNDIRVVQQLADEDQETDITIMNNQCEGTKRTGNIYFNGHKRTLVDSVRLHS